MAGGSAPQRRSLSTATTLPRLFLVGVIRKERIAPANRPVPNPGAASVALVAARPTQPALGFVSPGRHGGNDALPRQGAYAELTHVRAHRPFPPGRFSARRRAAPRPGPRSGIAPPRRLAPLWRVAASSVGSSRSRITASSPRDPHFARVNGFHNDTDVAGLFTVPREIAVAHGRWQASRTPFPRRSGKPAGPPGQGRARIVLPFRACALISTANAA